MEKKDDSELSLHFGHALLFALYHKDEDRLEFVDNSLTHDNFSKTAADETIEVFHPSEMFVRKLVSEL
ncbi:hypothetical protein JXA48_04160 [Candidatus Woesearchaeota archaeon]|nr:hypothetical protein [Candidatus Woesearchaeota archaeon]